MKLKIKQDRFLPHVTDKSLKHLSETNNVKINILKQETTTFKRTLVFQILGKEEDVKKVTDILFALEELIEMEKLETCETVRKLYKDVG